VKTIAFFNNKGSVGTTSLVYHLAWMYQELGVRVLAVDLDPQAHLTAAFLPESSLADFGGGLTARSEEIGDMLSLLPGHLDLSLLEDEADDQLTHHLREIVQAAGKEQRAELALIDLSPGLDPLSRAGLLASEHHIIPLKADLPSLQGLSILGTALRKWRARGEASPTGYVLTLNRPDRRDWPSRIACAYHREILNEREGSIAPEPDPYRLAILMPYLSLMVLAREARKPMFLLKPADGAIGGHSEAVQDCHRDFKALAIRIAGACGVQIPS
jgi:cellulose biosynthesis protein BcsQ